MAKNNRTIGDLLSNIDEEHSWRVLELSYLKTAISSVKNNKNPSGIEAVLLRSSMALLYAHWEGFIKSVATHYINYVSLQGVKNSDLRPNFLVLSYRKHLANLESGTVAMRQQAVTRFIDELDSKADVPYKGVVDTKSNLKFWVFKEICDNIGIDYSKYVLREKAIDRLLVDRRNDIAHGNYITIDKSDFVEIYDIVLDIMDKFLDDVKNAAIQKQYIK